MQDRFAIRFSLFALGFLSVATQINMIREFLNVFHGNELVLGIVLANWMLLTGLGARLGAVFLRIKGQTGFLLFLMVLLSVLPVIMIPGMYLIKAFLFPFGSMIGLGGVVYCTFLVLLPFCLANGLLFTSLSVLHTGFGMQGSLGRSYATESAGSLFSAFFISLALIWNFSGWDIARVFTLAFIVSVIIFSAMYLNRLHFFILAGLLMAGTASLRLFDLQGMTQSLFFPGQKLIADRNTPYGHVVVTENEGQQNYFENGVLLFSTGNVISSEESVHFTMVQHRNPESVLLISGGISGCTQEILKYHPSRIDYVELNPALPEIAGNLNQLPTNPALYVYAEDARKFLKSGNKKYGVVIMNLPGPSILQINRYFTLDFFELLKEKLNPGGVIGLSLPPTGDYLSENAGKLNSCIFNTLKKSFSQVLILPAGKNYFLASDASLSIDIPGLVSRKGISTLYVNHYYLDWEQMKERSDGIMKNLDPAVSLNLDFHPVAAFYQMDVWLNYFRVNSWRIAALVAGLLILVILSLNPVGAGLFSGGFTVAASEILIMIAIQVSFGFVFQVSGLVIMIFMGGLALGAWMMPRIFSLVSSRYFLILQIVLALFSLSLPFILSGLSRFNLPVWISLSMFGLLSLIISMAGGFLYSLACSISTGSSKYTVSRNYAADLFGSAFGALAVSVFLFPLFGLFKTCLVMVLLNVISALILLLRRNKLT